MNSASYLLLFTILLGIGVLKAEAQIPEHPYLFFTADDLPHLRTRLEQEPFKSRWRVFLHQAEYSLSQPVAEGGGRWDRTRVRKSLKICGLTGLAYAVTGDTRYGDRAKAELLAVLSADRWMNPGNERFTRGADLATADGALITALVYDWCYDRLNDNERKHIQDRIQHLAFDPYQKSINTNDWWVNNPVTNWSGVCHGGCGLAGLAFYHDMPIARAVFDSAAIYTPKFLNAVTGIDGAGHEGVMYFQYGVEYALRLMDAGKHFIDSDIFSKMTDRLVGYWLVYMQGPDGRYANFNNMDEHTFAGLGLAGLGNPPTGGPASSLLALLESHIPQGDSLLRWGADHGNASYIYWAPEPFYFLWRSNRPTVTEKPALNKAVLFRTAGHAIFQSPTLWLAYNGGWISDKSHHNLDLGSFVLVANNERFASDPGYNKQETGDHSTILINGQGQFKGASAKTLRFGSGNYFDYMLSDLSNAYQPEASLIRFHRHIVIMRGQYVVILDDLLCQTPAQFDWRLQTSKSMQIEKTRAILQGEKGNLHVLSSVSGVQITTGKATMNYVSLSPTMPNNQQTFATVLFPVATDHFPTATINHGELTITYQAQTDRLIFSQSKNGWMLQSVNDADATQIPNGTQRTVTSSGD